MGHSAMMSAVKNADIGHEREGAGPRVHTQSHTDTHTHTHSVIKSCPVIAPSRLQARAHSHSVCAGVALHSGHSGNCTANTLIASA